MLVEVIDKSGIKTVYGFDPQHKAEAIGFYQKLYWSGDIAGYKVMLGDGDIVAIGAVTH
jgi:hypothetical protein